jgi:hypothetical protein
MYQPYIRISTGNPYTVLDTVAKNPVGCIYAPPVNQNLPLTTKGFGAQPVLKYVYYASTTNPTPVAAPAPVYWTDESFTTVTGNAAEAYSAGVGVAGVAIVGYLLPNTVAIAGLTALELNDSYVFIQIGGWLGGAWAPTAGTSAIGNYITGLATGNWASSAAAPPTTGRMLGVEYSAVVGSVCDVLLGGIGTFWGS